MSDYVPPLDDMQFVLELATAGSRERLALDGARR
jgi:hypothetical protein